MISLHPGLWVTTDFPTFSSTYCSPMVLKICISVQRDAPTRRDDTAPSSSPSNVIKRGPSRTWCMSGIMGSFWSLSSATTSAVSCNENLGTHYIECSVSVQYQLPMGDVTGCLNVAHAFHETRATRSTRTFKILRVRTSSNDSVTNGSETNTLTSPMCAAIASFG